MKTPPKVFVTKRNRKRKAKIKGVKLKIYNSDSSIATHV